MPNFVSFAMSIGELADGEKSRTQSLTQSPRLLDASGTKALAIWNRRTKCSMPPAPFFNGGKGTKSEFIPPEQQLRYMRPSLQAA